MPWVPSERCLASLRMPRSGASRPGERAEALKEMKRICMMLDFANKDTKKAALSWWDKCDQPTVCLLLALKMHEHELMQHRGG
mmetsp:Transcript_19954/g.38495  ORF Transcript_19954/g.38495 Transcript_19954/m.38495 type:complete len:83 (-) Transcript_19954:221-469(-)